MESLQDTLKITDKFLSELVSEIDEILNPHEPFEVGEMMCAAKKLYYAFKWIETLSFTINKNPYQTISEC